MSHVPTARRLRKLEQLKQLAGDNWHGLPDEKKDYVRMLAKMTGKSTFYSDMSDKDLDFWIRQFQRLTGKDHGKKS